MRMKKVEWTTEINFTPWYSSFRFELILGICEFRIKLYCACWYKNNRVLLEISNRILGIINKTLNNMKQQWRIFSRIITNLSLQFYLEKIIELKFLKYHNICTKLSFFSLFYPQARFSLRIVLSRYTSCHQRTKP